MTERTVPQRQAERWDFGEKFTVWHFATKCELWNSYSLECTSEVGYSRNRPAMLCLHDSARILTAVISIPVSKCLECRITSLNPEIPDMLVLPCFQNVPGQIGEACTVAYTIVKWPRHRSKIRSRDHISNLACEASGTIIDYCWPWGISSSPRAAASATLPSAKWTWKWINDAISMTHLGRSGKPLHQLFPYEVAHGLCAIHSILRNQLLYEA